MAWLHISACILVASLLLNPTLAVVCPNSCVCSTTRDGLHRATCSNIAELHKYTIRQKHHNINILDLSHNNITKITHELDRLTEVVTLDLSTNGLTDINKFLHNARKLVHLNLANNRLKKLSLIYLPKSVSSLDLTNNLLKDVPSDVSHLNSLEHLELEGNPLDCSCDNLIIRDQLLATNVFIDNVKCHTPKKFVGRSWLELKTKDICKASKLEFLDMMMGDQPIDAMRVGEETTALKSMPLMAGNDLEDGNIIHGEPVAEDDDSVQFMKVGSFSSSSPISDIEGSGEVESTTISDINEPVQERKVLGNLLASEEILPVNNILTTESPEEGSGEGSGFFGFEYDEQTEKIPETTTPVFEELNPELPRKIFEDDDDYNGTTSEFPIPKPPSVYEGGSDWHSRKVEVEEVTEKAVTPQITRDTTVSEQIRITHASEVLGQIPSTEEEVTPHKTGTYVCIALIVVLLVGLIGFAITKGQMRKRRDRRLLRQQKRDVEKASKEMVDMNKSLLGKPAVVEAPIDKKINGKYELVPTHDTNLKKNENGDVGNGVKHDDDKQMRTDSPRDTNQNKSSSKDNNLIEDPISQQETSFESEPASPTSGKDRNSLSSEDIFVPIDDDTPRLNGNADSDYSQPLINGDRTNSDFLSPSREYVPVYSPDMGRVRIKMSETPKPKTPVLVTRSRSNAGDIIITPSVDGTARKSTT
ncbi:protein windpipe [Colias croceus]|uniref:protein windpipe n=1 Tax=Colias crocea TaxID=72248 RepID=UPI001E27FB66|nr:protein windpipe [Colias croceus]